MTTIEKAILASARAFEVKPESIKLRSRRQEEKFARFCAIRIARDSMPSLSLNTIAEAVGRTHVSAIYAIKRTDLWIEMKDPAFFNNYEKAKQIFQKL